MELLNRASWLTQRTIYDADRNLRKGVAPDETHSVPGPHRQGADRPAGPRPRASSTSGRCSLSQLAGDLLRVSVRVPGQRGVRRPDRRRGGPVGGAAAAAGAHRRRLRGDAGDVSCRGPGTTIGLTTPRASSLLADGHGGVVRRSASTWRSLHLEHVRRADTNSGRRPRDRSPGRPSGDERPGRVDLPAAALRQALPAVHPDSDGDDPTSTPGSGLGTPTRSWLGRAAAAQVVPARRGGGRGAVRRRADRPARRVRRGLGGGRASPPATRTGTGRTTPEDTGGDRWLDPSGGAGVWSSYALLAAVVVAVRRTPPTRWPAAAPGGAHGRGGGRRHDPDWPAGDGPGTGLQDAAGADRSRPTVGSLTGCPRCTARPAASTRRSATPAWSGTTTTWAARRPGC
ncbi:hypothetical protein HBB16_05700 [Pseudonocardia sp. MCCB 268]|nr:hypothetical protein [Pseudonocardia cytotoxica]